MFFDSWHKDSFLPMPPENMQQNDFRCFFLLAAIVALISTGSRMFLRRKKK